MALSNVHLLYWGDDLEFRGLFLDTLDKINLRDQEVELKPEHRYLVLYNDDGSDEEQPHLILKNKYNQHFGPRSEGFFDFTKCDYLTTKDLIYFKFIYKRYKRQSQWIDEDQYEAMSKMIDNIKQKLRNAELETGVSRRTGNRWYRFSFDVLKDVDESVMDFCNKPDYIKPQIDIKRTIRARTRDEIEQWFNYLINKPVETVLGLDYETCNGFPMESPTFEEVGVGIACCDDEATGIYFDTQWMKYKGKDNEYDLFKELYRKYLDKFENSTTYNNAFEQKVTYLMLKKLCLFEEASTANKLDGIVYRRLSLKYTAQRCLHVKSWDRLNNCSNYKKSY